MRLDSNMYVQRTPITCTEPEIHDGRKAGARELSISIIVPVFNNAESLPALHARLITSITDTDPFAEIVYVNDGSTDSSFEVIKGLLDSHAMLVDLQRNFGQSAAVLAGFSVARGSIFVTIDADLENHPEDIPLLVDAIREGSDLACGVRIDRQVASIRKISSLAANKLVGRALSVNLRDWGCGLNAVRVDVARRMLSQVPLPKLPKIEGALLATRIAQVPVSHSVREHGKSGYSLWRLMGFAIAFLSAFSVKRTFKRLFTASETRPIPGPLDVLSWLLLSIVSLFVRLGTLLLPSTGDTSFAIRDIFDGRRQKSATNS